MTQFQNGKDANLDPLTGAPGAHPVGTGMGAAAGGAAGAMAGKGAAELIDPTAEEACWRGNYANEPYYTKGRDFNYYGPAYKLGYEGRVKYDGRSYEEVEASLAKDYVETPDTHWDDIRPVTRAAWDRADQRIRNATRN